MALLWPITSQPVEGSFSPGSHLFEDALFYKIRKISIRGSLGNSRELPIIGIGDPASLPDVIYGLELTVIQVTTLQSLSGEPVPAQRNDERAPALLKLGLRQAGYLAKFDHGLSAGTNPLNIASQVERFCNERIVRY